MSNCIKRLPFAPLFRDYTCILMARSVISIHLTGVLRSPLDNFSSAAKHAFDYSANIQVNELTCRLGTCKLVKMMVSLSLKT